ncbi:MAG: hypothetical protein WKF47_11155 [Geodermatophilaceae bacterium]
MAARGVLAHGVGGRQNLPLPFELLVQGAVLALLVSFLGLGLLWRTPGCAQARPGGHCRCRSSAPSTAQRCGAVGVAGVGPGRDRVRHRRGRPGAWR